MWGLLPSGRAYSRAGQNPRDSDKCRGGEESLEGCQEVWGGEVEETLSFQGGKSDVVMVLQVHSCGGALRKPPSAPPFVFVQVGGW